MATTPRPHSQHPSILSSKPPTPTNKHKHKHKHGLTRKKRPTPLPHKREAKRRDRRPELARIDPADGHGAADMIPRLAQRVAGEQRLHAEEVAVEEGGEDDLVDDDFGGEGEGAGGVVEGLAEEEEPEVMGRRRSVGQRALRGPSPTRCVEWLGDLRAMAPTDGLTSGSSVSSSSLRSPRCGACGRGCSRRRRYIAPRDRRPCRRPASR